MCIKNIFKIIIAEITLEERWTNETQILTYLFNFYSIVSIFVIYKTSKKCNFSNLINI